MSGAAAMRIELHKISDERHRLVIERGDGTGDAAECVTRSFLVHDLLHYAVEAEAGTETGFWGLLAAGRSLEDMADRSGEALGEGHDELMQIEGVVGALTALTKGVAPADVWGMIAANPDAFGHGWPAWLDETFVHRVAERMRQLTGQWRAVPFGRAMALVWPG